MLICKCQHPQNFKKVAVIYKYLYIINNKINNKDLVEDIINGRFYNIA